MGAVGLSDRGPANVGQHRRPPAAGVHRSSHTLQRGPRAMLPLAGPMPTHMRHEMGHVVGMPHHGHLKSPERPMSPDRQPRRSPQQTAGHARSGRRRRRHPDAHNRLDYQPGCAVRRVEACRPPRPQHSRYFHAQRRDGVAAHRERSASRRRRRGRCDTFPAPPATSTASAAGQKPPPSPTPQAPADPTAGLPSQRAASVAAGATKAQDHTPSPTPACAPATPRLRRQGHELAPGAARGRRPQRSRPRARHRNQIPLLPRQAQHHHQRNRPQHRGRPPDPLQHPRRRNLAQPRHRRSTRDPLQPPIVGQRTQTQKLKAQAPRNDDLPDRNRSPTSGRGPTTVCPVEDRPHTDGFDGSVFSAAGGERPVLPALAAAACQSGRRPMVHTIAGGACPGSAGGG